MSTRLFFTLASLLVVALSVGCMLVGAVDIAPREVVGALTGSGNDEVARTIVLESRLPAYITAVMAGIALGVGGLLMQTVLENPLAEPSVLGVSAGASLGAAIALLLPGVAIAGTLTAGGTWLTVVLALTGSLLVIALLAVCSTLLRSNVLVLIAGVMVSYIVGSGTSLLAFYATDYGVQSYVFWGMGDFGQLSSERTLWFAIAVALGLLPLPLLTKWLDALLLGSDYASALGLRVRRVRTYLLVICGYLTAIVTAACGPIAFIGLAAPHAARFLLRRSHHALLLPATALTGMVLTLLTSFIAHLPSTGSTLPINAITPIMGVPVMMTLILKHRSAAYQ